MAKKSNKTAHVLNLISNSKHIAVETENQTPPEGNIPEDIHPTIKNSLEKAAKSEALSNLIKENLEKEISNELKTNTDSNYLPPSDNLKNETNQNSPYDTEIINSNTTDDLQYAETKYNETQPTPDNTYKSEEMTTVDSDKKAENNIADKDYKSENSTTTATEYNSQNDLTKENTKSDSPAPDNNIENIQTTQDDSLKNSTASSDNSSQENKKEEFIYINICEELVRDKVSEYMDKFSVCKCERCVADTMALALTNLPPKYVVLNSKDEIPFISFYENKYRILLMTELTKACLTVNDNPRHNKDWF